jgi:hypothetical protein
MLCNFSRGPTSTTNSSLKSKSRKNRLSLKLNNPQKYSQKNRNKSSNASRHYSLSPNPNPKTYKSFRLNSTQTTPSNRKTSSNRSKDRSWVRTGSESGIKMVTCMRAKWRRGLKVAGGSIITRAGRGMLGVLLMIRSMAMAGTIFCLGLSMREIGAVA